jgi:hypothetical protein|tara:strand:+ start:765 stop:1049 length:285 start_codon:yes stop_codon:yes gene_type:complete
MKLLEAQYGMSEGISVQLYEAQYILTGTQGFTATFADPNDPRITFTMNLSDKKIDLTGPNGMISITDELSPAERANMIRRAKGAMVDVNVSSLR